MRTYKDKKIDFLLSIFTELNEHIRATDAKSVLIAGSFVALIAAVITALIDKLNTISWTHFIFSSFILLIGFCVLELQFRFRDWKKHYLEICCNITSKFQLEEKFLPVWLRTMKRKSFADKFLLMITILINITIFIYSLYLLWNLMKDLLIAKTIIIVLFSISYFSLLIITHYLSSIQDIKQK